MAKVTKELIEQLIVEELENLSEEELNEINPLSGIGAGIAGAFKGVKDKYQQGRGAAVAKALGAEYAKKLGKIKANMDKIAGDLSKTTKKYEKLPYVKDMFEKTKFLAQITQTQAAVNGAIKATQALASAEPSAEGKPDASDAAAGGQAAPANRTPEEQKAAQDKQAQLKKEYEAAVKQTRAEEPQGPGLINKLKALKDEYKSKGMLEQ